MADNFSLTEGAGKQEQRTKSEGCSISFAGKALGAEFEQRIAQQKFRNMLTGNSIDADSVSNLAWIALETGVSAYGSHWLYVAVRWFLQ